MRVAINGFGRIGRQVMRALVERQPLVEVAAMNDLTDLATSAHMLKYDSNYGRYPDPVSTGPNALVVGGKSIPYLQVKDWTQLPWLRLGVDVVIEATGVGTCRERAAAHLSAGAKKVLITAPSRDAHVTLVLGVNEDMYDPARHAVISNASCTTNGLAPALAVVHREFEVVKGLMSTIHAYTATQSLVDGPRADLHDARAAALNIVPTDTGAAKAIGLVIPELNGRMHGGAYRVPVPTVSIVEFVVQLKRRTTADAINKALRAAADNGRLAGILAVSDEPLVSMDLKGSSYSSIVDAGSTMVIGDDLAKVAAWYDNEWGYACRVADVAALIGAHVVSGATA